MRPRNRNASEETANTTKFLNRMLTVFLARQKPDSTSANPRFMKNTRNAAIITQIVSSAIFRVRNGVGELLRERGCAARPRPAARRRWQRVRRRAPPLRRRVAPVRAEREVSSSLDFPGRHRSTRSRERGRGRICSHRAVARSRRCVQKRPREGALGARCRPTEQRAARIGSAARALVEQLLSEAVRAACARGREAARTVLAPPVLHTASRSFVAIETKAARASGSLSLSEVSREEDRGNHPAIEARRPEEGARPSLDCSAHPLRGEGAGRQKGHAELYRGAEYVIDLVPKLKVEIVVPDPLVHRLLADLEQWLWTGKIGDGRSSSRRSPTRCGCEQASEARLRCDRARRPERRKTHLSSRARALMGPRQRAGDRPVNA